jgi:hypothetical protein
MSNEQSRDHVTAAVDQKATALTSAQLARIAHLEREYLDALLYLNGGLCYGETYAPRRD